MAFKNKEDSRRYHKQWYAKNRSSRIRTIYADRKRRQVIARKYVYDFLRKNPCMECGETDILVLDFDHVRGKKVANISDMLASGRTLLVIIEEMEKCEVVCANDHRRRTYSRGKFARNAS